MKKWFFYFGFACWMASPQAKASVLWDFSGATTTPVVALGGLEVSSLENVQTWGQVNYPFPVSSPSEGYPSASGGEHLGSAVKTGDENLWDATYSSFILSVTLDHQMFILESVSFGSRSTSTGPQAYSLRWSLDGFATDLASGMLMNDSAWGFYSAIISDAQIVAPQSVEMRLYWFGGEGTAFSGVVNHRLDDLLLTGSFQPIPEPAVGGGVAMAMGIFLLKILRARHMKKRKRKEKINSCFAESKMGGYKFGQWIIDGYFPTPIGEKAHPILQGRCRFPSLLRNSWWGKDLSNLSR